MKLSEILNTDSQYITLPIEVFLKNKNTPLYPLEIYENIKSKLLTNGTTPVATLNSTLGKYLKNSPHKKIPIKNSFFERKDSPYKYYIIPDLYEKLINLDIDDVNISFKEENNIPYNVEAFTKPTKKNPLKQAICILGESGNGKTFTTMETLEKENHKILYQIIDESQEHILYEYIPHEQRYELSTIGEFILEAKFNPDMLYTIVFDECHKYLDKVNNSLLQCISLERNKGERFLQKDRKIVHLYEELEDSNFGKKIPDNLGFIFISSKPSNIEANIDFKNRLKFYELKKDYDNTNFTLDYLKSNEFIFEENS